MPYYYCAIPAVALIACIEGQYVTRFKEAGEVNVGRDRWSVCVALVIFSCTSWYISIVISASSMLLDELFSVELCMYVLTNLSSLFVV